MVVSVIIFDYFGVLSQRFGEVDKEILELIKKSLHGRYRLAVLSNMNQASPEAMLGECASLFDMVMISSELGVAKPDPRAFRQASRRLREFPESCLFIDDSETNCLAAKEVGMSAIAYKGVDDLKQKLTDYGILTP